MREIFLVVKSEKKGFTLVELLVVIVVLGILVTIGPLMVRDSLLVFSKAYEEDVETASRILTTDLYFALLNGIDIEGKEGKMV